MSADEFRREIQASNARSEAFVDEMVALHDRIERDGPSPALLARMQEIEAALAVERELFTALADS